VPGSDHQASSVRGLMLFAAQTHIAASVLEMNNYLKRAHGEFFFSVFDFNNFNNFDFWRALITYQRPDITTAIRSIIDKGPTGFNKF
jgi:hypothetical protein